MKRLRKVKAQWANRNLPVYPGTPERPQGRLLSFQEGGRAPMFDARFTEAARRRQTGEPNPGAPWESGLILQHHFLTDRWGRPRKPPEQQRMF